MRYIIETKDEEGIIGIYLSKLQKEKKLEIIEKADPVVEIKGKLEKISRALETLRKSGWNKEVMLGIFILLQALFSIIPLLLQRSSQSSF